MSGTVPTFLRGAQDMMETVCTADIQAPLCFLAVVCWVERKVVFIGSNVYMKSARFKGTFPMYESMKCQNFNPKENCILPSKKLFISAACGETAISKILYEFPKGNCIFAIAA